MRMGVAPGSGVDRAPGRGWSKKGALRGAGVWQGWKGLFRRAWGPKPRLPGEGVGSRGEGGQFTLEVSDLG